MAKNNTSDIAAKVLNITIVLAVIGAVYFLYRWLKNHSGTIGSLFGTLTGTGGPQPANKTEPPTSTNTAEKILSGYISDIVDAPHNLLVATQLSRANKEAAPFTKKPGSTPNINKALKSLTDLADTDFVTVIKEWQSIDGFKDVLETPLASNYINNGKQSTFLTRYSILFNKMTLAPAVNGHPVMIL